MQSGIPPPVMCAASLMLRRDEYLAMGILHITNAVSFLNNDCKLVRVVGRQGPGVMVMPGVYLVCSSLSE